MRDIKFRAWDRNKMSFNPYISDGSDGGETSWVNMNNAINSYDGILMQFTGLCDRSGKDIYDGDILAPYGNITMEPQMDECFEVKFEKGSYNIGNESDTDYCIIGNIHQNPELLK